MGTILSFLLSLFLLSVLAAPGRAFTSEFVVSGLNALRAAPLAAAEGAGLDTGEVLSRWPRVLHPLLREGLPPLAQGEGLAELARLRAGEFVSGRYRDRAAFEASLEEAASWLRETFPVVEEVFAVLVFENFIPDEEAVRLLLYHLIREALLADSRAELFLSPCFTHAGAAYVFAQVELESRTYNAYVLAVELGVSAESRPPVILGRVAAGDGAPVSGARVDLLSPSGDFLVGVVTSPGGHYCLPFDGTGLFVLRSGPARELLFILSPTPRRVDLLLPGG